MVIEYCRPSWHEKHSPTPMEGPKNTKTVPDTFVLHPDTFVLHPDVANLYPRSITSTVGWINQLPQRPTPISNELTI